MWISLNRCDLNLGIDLKFKSIKTAIERIMSENSGVYQLDTLDELAKFIKETR